MQIIKKDLKQGIMVLKITNLEDFWYLSYIIRPGDKLKTSMSRKVKLDKGNEKSQNTIRNFTGTIIVEKVDYEPDKQDLRINGIITEAPEDIPKSYQGVSLENNSVFTLQKDNFLSYEMKNIEKLSKGDNKNILIVAMDRKEASFALLRNNSYEYLFDLEGEVQNKREPDKNIKGEFYDEIIKLINLYNGKYSPATIIIASPAFWKEEIAKFLKNEGVNKKVIFATCNNTGRNGINEVLKRPEVGKALEMKNVVRENEIIDELFLEISKDRNFVYGLKDVKEASESGNIKELIVTEKMIKKYIQNNKFLEIEDIMRDADDSKSEIHIISEKNDESKRVDGLGGIAGITRYKIRGE